jgi:hypothetical protein
MSKSRDWAATQIVLIIMYIPVRYKDPPHRFLPLGNLKVHSFLALTFDASMPWRAGLVHTGGAEMKPI